MSKCRACGRAITFRSTRNEKQQPVNLDGTIHFATCTGKPLSKRPSAHTPKQTPMLIEVAGCPHGCSGGWIPIVRDGVAGVVSCPIHRK